MAARALLQHYLEYLTSPAVILTLVIAVGPILLAVAAERAAAASTPKGLDSIAGCRRLGLVGRSNLSKQFETQAPSEKARPRVRALFTYPIKSCRGVELPASEVQSSGLKYDRLFTFAQLVSKPAPTAEKDAQDVREPSEEWTHQWRFITQREFPRLALVQTELYVPDVRSQPLPKTNGKTPKASSGRDRPRSPTRGSPRVGQLEKGDKVSKSSSLGDPWAKEGGCLLVRFPYEPDFNPFGLRTEQITLALPLVPSQKRAESKGYPIEEISIWKDHPRAINMTTELAPATLQELRSFLGVSNSLGLFRVDESQMRSVNRCLPQDRISGEGFKVGFADAFPVNLMGIASVREIDSQLVAGSVKGKLDARRFRANIYISGTAPFDEDTWKKITVGRRIGRNEKGLFECDAEYHVACRTARCKLPNVDPDTGVRDKNEPYTTLGKTRKVDEGAKPHPCLGMQTIPLFERGIVRVGDEIKIVATGEHCYEKMFT